MRVQVDIYSATPAPPADDPLSDYYVLLHDFDTDVWAHRPRPLWSRDDGLLDDHGYPEMVPFTERKGMPLSKVIQWFWFDLCVLSQYGTVFGTAEWNRLSKEQQRKIASEWGTFTDSKRFATNHAGTDVNANHIAERILGQPLKSGTARQLEVACGGNMIKAMSHTPVLRLAANENGDKEQVECIESEVWNGIHPAPNALTFNWLTHPHLVHRATIATPFGYDRQPSKTGPWRVDPFSFFGEAGSPYALYFSSPNYVPLHRVRRLKASEVAAVARSSYHP